MSAGEAGGDVGAFIEARLAEDEDRAKYALSRGDDGMIDFAGQWFGAIEHAALHSPERVLRQVAAIRAAVALHKDWPILVTTPPKWDAAFTCSVDSSTFHLSQQVAWLTEQEYRARFGTEPPTAPIVAAIAAIWADHPDYPLHTPATPPEGASL